jgi:hypothetical protein
VLQDRRCVNLHIHEISPRLRVGAKAGHEGGVAIATPVLATQITVDSIIGDARFIEEGSGLDLSDYWQITHR